MLYMQAIIFLEAQKINVSLGQATIDVLHGR